MVDVVATFLLVIVVVMLPPVLSRYVGLKKNSTVLWWYLGTFGGLLYTYLDYKYIWELTGRPCFGYEGLCIPENLLMSAVGGIQLLLGYFIIAFFLKGSRKYWNLFLLLNVAVVGLFSLGIFF